MAAIFGFVLFCMPGVTQAGPITWGPDTYDPANDVYFASGGAACTVDNPSATCESLAYAHDLTLYGFVPGASSDDQLTGGLLEILLRDDEGDQPSEGFKIELEGLLQPGTQDGATSFSFSGIAGSLLASLQNDGVLQVILARQHGDFVFDRSTFTANGVRESEISEPLIPGVPEPGTLALLATGVVGLMTRRRRRMADTWGSAPWLRKPQRDR